MENEDLNKENTMTGAEKESVGVESKDNLNNEEISLVELLKNPKYQAEFDKLNAKSLETARANWEEDKEKEVQEAEKLAKLSAEEKQKVLLQKQEEKLKEKEKRLALKEMELTAISILDNKNLPVNLVDFLVCEEAEKTNTNIENFEKAFRKAVEDAVNDRLRGEPPIESQSTIVEGKKYTLTEIGEISKADPKKAQELLKKLNKRKDD